MAQTKEGALKVRAAKCGLDAESAKQLEISGQKYCYCCKRWRLRESFHADKSRYDGRAALCRECKSAATRLPAAMHRKPINPLTGKPGPAKNPWRDGDKRQARAQVNLAVRNGEMPRPNSLPCKHCGHIGPGKRHEYHHHNGYEAKCFLAVIPLCSQCHSAVHEGESEPF